MPKTLMRAVALAAGAIITVTVAAAPATAQITTVADGQYLGSVARTPDGRSASTAAAQEVLRFWTPQRMRDATPARLPASPKAASSSTLSTAGSRGGTPMRTEPGLPSVAAITEAARAVGAPISTDAAVAAVTRTAGKVFFIDPIDGKEHFCSGATVNSVKRRLVVTAGHCVHNGLWMQGWIFAPQYTNGAPFGTWIAGNLAARTDWIFTGLPAADVGVAIMANNISGQRIVDVVGGNGLAWNQPLGQRVDVFGYPGAINFQRSCAGPSYTGVEVGHIGTGPCPDWGPGGSGAPMLLAYGSLGAGLGYVNSVATNIYSPRPNEVFGPYFDNLNAGLLFYAESISP